MKELYAIDKSTLDAIGNAIREKKGTIEPIPVTSLADEILSISSGGGNVIKAGTYKMVEYHAEYEFSGLFSWWSQKLNGKLTWVVKEPNGGQYTYASNEPFTSINTDGEYCVFFDSNSGMVGGSIVSPSFNDDWKIQIVVDADTNVSESFKYWFDVCFFRSTDFYS